MVCVTSIQGIFFGVLWEEQKIDGEQAHLWEIPV